MSADKQKKFRFSQSEIFRKQLSYNNNLLFLTLLTITILGNIATILVKISGKGSAYLTYEAIYLEMVLVSIPFLVAFFLSRAFSGKRVSSYIAITGVMIAAWFFQYMIYGASEIFAVHHMMIALSIFYFDKYVSLYTLMLVLISQTTLFWARPELLPVGPKSNIAIRYIVYIFVSISSYQGAKAIRRILDLAIEKSEETNFAFVRMQNVAETVVATVEMLQNLTKEQEFSMRDMGGISAKQAVSIAEISTSLDKLSVNSDSLKNVADELYQETKNIVNAIDDLKNVDEQLQKSSLTVVNLLKDVTTHSEHSMRFIQNTLGKFLELKGKSQEMSSFVQVINEIAAQVNLLSLNAAIEAARAGEAGRGFAVVADEISKLADATSVNAKKIEQMIRDNQTFMDDSNQSINMTSQTMQLLYKAMQEIQERVGQTKLLLVDLQMTTMTITKLNLKIHDSSKVIEESTAQQKIATQTSSQTVHHFTKAAQEMVTIADKMVLSMEQIHDHTVALETVSRKLLETKK